MTFTTESMQEILPLLRKELRQSQTLSFCVLNPDLADKYAGSRVVVNGTTYLYRGYKAWTDLAEILKCRMMTPQKEDDTLVRLHFKKLAEASFHQENTPLQEEKYGTDSHFSRINKMEEPAFLHYYLQALENVHIARRERILDLGINRADEFEVIRKMLDMKTYHEKELVGVDHSESAIDHAKTLFPEKNVSFHRADINHLEKLDLGRFDLLISIGTLQSPGIDYKPFLMKLVQKHLKKDSALILGFPNSRWTGGEMVYGAKAPNYAMSEMSLLFNDVIFAKKYLQQKKYRVTITGKTYIFLTATKII
jgi:trans-aconitate methyltransferase